MAETLFESDGRRAAVHRQGFQRVHSDLGNDAHPNLAVYPQSNAKIERWHKSLKGSASGQERRYRSMMHGGW